MAGLYEVLISHLFSRPVLDKLRLQGQTCLQQTSEEDYLADTVEALDRGTREARLKFCLFKILHDCYWNPVKLHKIGLLPHASCWCYADPRCDLLHVLSSCPSVQPLWKAVEHVLVDSMQHPTPLPPSLFMLHDTTSLPALSRPQKKLLHTALANAKICIVRHWRSETHPTPEDWIVAMISIATHERVIYNIQDQAAIFAQVWAPFLPDV
ncbi:hypothetical protein NDU88_005350 [Pleurodeles waltl]|uniref:Reverse transcriptase zinc-binding domain-containing protein n=1 Tax=Pleurodeles waltl TaxID=8319 RepID=A0AAV7UJM8_PLEWA|nr:hypothetical protein NDU88_005350 [Pleurodeles waltl]